MTAKSIYEAILIELSKVNAPALKLHEFNYLCNKVINQFINEVYNIYDINQQTTDDLRVLKATAELTPTKVKLNRPTVANQVTKENALKGAVYEIELPQDYLHLLNCVCVYYINTNYKCYDKGDFIDVPAKRLTADSWSNIMDDIYNRPSPLNPYYYIHNRNQQANLPTNYKGTDISLSSVVIYQGWYMKDTGSSPREVYAPTANSAKWYSDKEFTVEATTLENVTHIEKIQGDVITNVPFTRSITLKVNSAEKSTSAVDKEAYLRISNPQPIRCEIRYGMDDSIFQLAQVQVDYIKSPQFIRLTQEQIDRTADTSQIMEFPDYICTEIINKLVTALMERSQDPRLATNIQINRTIARPTEQQSQTNNQA